MEGFASAVLLVSMCMCGQVSVHMNSLEEINENVLDDFLVLYLVNR